ncbi:MAG: ribosome biogenesis GTP-binding protein YihA/YsxC [Saprospiraceae bacterium]
MARTMQEVRYVGSYPSITSCPKDKKPEYAFIGRSNVGKSSLINMLTGRNGLARISKKPGKTQMINYFLVEKAWYLVDLPGYGYAKISKKKRREWEIMIEGYLQHRRTLACAFVLIDANIPAQQIDIEFLNWLGDKNVPFAIVYTKTDRLKPAEVQPNIDRIRASFLAHWSDLPQEFITSSVKKEGQTEILAFVDGINQEI